MRDATLQTFEQDREPTAAERALIAAVRAGQPAVIAPDRPTARAPDDANLVRTDLIEYLVLGGCDTLRPRGKGVQLIGAWIEPPEGSAELDLESETLAVDLALMRCRINAPINLLGATAKSIHLSGSQLAQSNADGVAFYADRLTTGGGVFLRAAGDTRFEAEGAVRLLGAKIGGNLECVGARLTAGPTAAAGAALHADGLTTGGDVFLRAAGETRFEAEGAVRLLGAKIGGNLECDGARLTAAPTAAVGAALNADRLTTGGGVFLRAAGETRFEAEGAVLLLGAKIGGNLDCEGARLTAGPTAAAGAALHADGLTTGGDVFLRAAGETRFEAEGAVRLLGAKIGGNLDCVGARLTAGPTAAQGAALHADRLTTGGGVLLRAAGDTRFEAEGALRLLGAKIGGNLVCVGGRFTATHGAALVLQSARIEGLLQLWDAPGTGAAPAALFTGGVDLTDAATRGLMDAPHAWPDPVDQGRWRIRRRRGGLLTLDGFRYEAFSGSRFPKTAAARGAWLERQRPAHLGDDFRPQPWRQVEKTFEEMGELLEARRLAVRRERARRRAGLVALFRYKPLTGAVHHRIYAALCNLARWPLNLLVNGTHRFFGFTVGYGYFNLRALIPVLAVIALGWLVFSQAYEDGTIAPPLPVVLNSEAWKTCDKTPNPAACWVEREKPGRDYYQFNAFLYSLDLFLPVVTIEQEHFWSPTPGRGTALAESWLGRMWRRWFDAESHAWLERRSRVWGPGDQPWTLGDLAWCYRILHEILGYVLSAFIVAGLARLVRERA